MHIVFLTRRLWPIEGGVEKHVYQLSQLLARDGHHIDIIYASGRTHHAPRLSENIQLHTITETSSKLTLWKQIISYFPLFLEADIIHCHDVFFWYLPLRFLLVNKGVYTTFHGYETVYPPRKGAIYMRRLSQLLSTGTINVGSFIEKWYGTRSTATIYGAIKKNDMQTHTKQRKKQQIQKIVFLGRMSDDIGSPAYLAALKRYSKRFQLTAYGQGPYRSEFQKLGDVFSFADNLPEELTNADTVLASSYLSILTGLATGAHVISYAENPLKMDYLTLSPFMPYITICTSIDEIVSALPKQLTNKQKKIQMQFAFSLTWERIKDVYYQVWQKK